MKTPREVARAGIDHPHWRKLGEEFSGLSHIVAAGIDDLTTDVAYEIEARDKEWQVRVEAARVEGLREALAVVVSPYTVRSWTGCKERIEALIAKAEGK